VYGHLIVLPATARPGPRSGRRLGPWSRFAASAAEQQRRDAVSYCMQRYRSYDPNSQTYLGRDGLRRSCP
jgi:hypothetical protein